jgi:hypothetical protein
LNIEADNSWGDFCAFDDQDWSGGQAKGPGLASNISPDLRELKKARYQVGDRLMNIMIARFDPGHITTPANLRMERCHASADGGTREGQPDEERQ